MSIEQAKVIDFISTRDESTCILSISDHLEWGTFEHLMMIQQKLNIYLAFIESGEIYGTYPNAKGLDIKIELICQYHPDDEGIKFLKQCREIIEAAGFKFSHKCI
jgi:hypothetical protein